MWQQHSRSGLSSDEKQKEISWSNIQTNQIHNSIFPEHDSLLFSSKILISSSPFSSQGHEGYTVSLNFQLMFPDFINVHIERKHGCNYPVGLVSALLHFKKVYGSSHSKMKNKTQKIHIKICPEKPYAPPNFLFSKTARKYTSLKMPWSTTVLSADLAQNQTVTFLFFSISVLCLRIS